MKIKLVKFTTGEYGIKKEGLLGSKFYDFAEGEFSSYAAPTWRCCRHNEEHARKVFNLLTSKCEVIETR